MRYIPIIVFTLLLLSSSANALNDPIVTLISPEDNKLIIGTLTQDFTFLPQGFNITLCELYTNESGWMAVANISCSVPRTIFPNKLNIIVGSKKQGNINDLRAVDGNELILHEVNGIPGFNYTFNFTDGFQGNLSITILGRYDPGNAGHQRTFDIWNVTGQNWLTLGTILLNNTNQWHNYTVINATNFIMADNSLLLSAVHPTGGTGNHELVLEYMAINGLINPTNFTQTIQHTFNNTGIYAWNVECTDNKTTTNFADNNRTLIIAEDNNALVLLCLRDGFCEDWWIKDQFDNIQRNWNNVFLFFLLLITLFLAKIDSNETRTREFMVTEEI